jgi:hypothetical protein
MGQEATVVAINRRSLLESEARQRREPQRVSSGIEIGQPGEGVNVSIPSIGGPLAVWLPDVLSGSALPYPREERPPLLLTQGQHERLSQLLQQQLQVLAQQRFFFFQASIFLEPGMRSSVPKFEDASTPVQTLPGIDMHRLARFPFF